MRQCGLACPRRSVPRPGSARGGSIKNRSKSTPSTAYSERLALILVVTGLVITLVIAVITEEVRRRLGCYLTQSADPKNLSLRVSNNRLGEGCGAGGVHNGGGPMDLALTSQISALAFGLGFFWTMSFSAATSASI